MLYEVNSMMLEMSREMYLEDHSEFPTQEALEVFRQSDTKKMVRNLTLHLADLSNSMKPFRVARIWAWQVLEEFFLQGDLERKAGIPIQMLNDRDKVNKAFSQ